MADIQSQSDAPLPDRERPALPGRLWKLVSERARRHATQHVTDLRNEAGPPKIETDLEYSRLISS